ncbi:MAG: YbhB/YbcL family Raf kinase inhibitor-like protein [Bacteroidota bacterium]
MLVLESPAYREGGVIPLRHAHRTVAGGANLSPPLRWSDPPLHTRSFALSIVDIHPVAGSWLHWLVFDIPFRVRSLPEGASRTDLLPPPAREAVNGFGETGYGGPAPPPGSGRHTYVASLYALNVASLPRDCGQSLRRFERALEGVLIEEARLAGCYER